MAIVIFLHSQLDILKEIEPPPPKKNPSHPSHEVYVEVGVKDEKIFKEKNYYYLSFSIKEKYIWPFQVSDFYIYRLKIHKISIMLSYRFCHLSR